MERKLKPVSALQEWTQGLTIMQQSVLLAAIRGPDTIRKDHVAKLLLRWFRRCILISAFDGRALTNPYEDGGGSFTGPSLRPAATVEEAREMADKWPVLMAELLKDYLKTVDELPHHFQLHFMHAAEIIGYKHPDPTISAFWNYVYTRLVNDMHLLPEDEDHMDYRLGDCQQSWRACEEVVAAQPGDQDQPDLWGEVPA